jgi:hypothetical protein
LNWKNGYVFVKIEMGLGNNIFLTFLYYLLYGLLPIAFTAQLPLRAVTFTLAAKVTQTASQTEGFFAALAIALVPNAWPLPTKSGKTWAWFLSRPGRSRPVLSENPEALQPHLPCIVLPDFLPKLSV